jgi:hypothetical protein
MLRGARCVVHAACCTRLRRSVDGHACDRPVLCPLGAQAFQKAIDAETLPAQKEQLQSQLVEIKEHSKQMWLSKYEKDQAYAAKPPTAAAAAAPKPNVAAQSEEQQSRDDLYLYAGAAAAIVTVAVAVGFYLRSRRK